jgi:hypothetical protein
MSGTIQAAGLVVPRIRCAPFHGSLAADPIGSAGSYDAFLFVEVPLPWEKDISMNEPFRSMMERAASVVAPDGTRWRPMGVTPADAGDGSRTVTAFRCATDDRGGVGPYDRREWRLPGAEVEGLCRALLRGAASDVDGFGGRLVHVDDATVDLYVCTHGRRDSCCGSLGPGLHQEMEGVLSVRPAAVRLHRCSHTGGHRFAPTALTFPDGYAWAHLGVDVADHVVRRDTGPARVAAHCRGSSLFDGGPAQAADRAALVQVGWSWAGAVRRAEVVAFERDTLATTVGISGTTADGDTHAFTVRVEVERHIPTPTCGVVEGPEYQVEPVWRVADLQRVGGSTVQ